MRAVKSLIVFCALALVVIWPGLVWGHVFLERADPRVGATVGVSPGSVRIWFDGVLEPAFSTIRVRDASGNRVDNGDSHVDSNNEKLLEVLLLPHLAPGAYKVIWSVVARDGHRTEGDYTFTVGGI